MTGDAGRLLQAVIEYSSRLPSEALTGDVFAVTIVLIAFYLVVMLINQLTGLIIFLLKRIVLLAIILSAYYQFLLFLVAKIAAEGWTQDNMILGAAGTIVGLIATATALYAALLSLKRVKKKAPQETKPEPEAEVEPKPEETGIGQIISMKSLKNEKSLGAILAYMVIAQFGVFSSKTISAPSSTVGIIFFLVFMCAAVLYIRQSYHDTIRGLRHLGAAFAVGVVLSIVLGNLWGSIPIKELLSQTYFASESLVAFVTGLALSLFMGSKS